MKPLPALRPALCLSLILAQFVGGCRSPEKPGDSRADSGFGERVGILQQQVADSYSPTRWHDRGKYSFPKAIARMEVYGLEDGEAAGYIREYADGTYGFFHFPFVGMARLLCGYPESSAIRANRADFLERILLHDPGDHFNALTGEGTENHVSMSRTSGYLFAQEAAGVPELEESAERWMRLLKPWILDWAYRIYHYGTGEWDSNPYTAYNLVGWLNLYDFAEDPEVRRAAGAVLDYYAANIALKLTQGLLGGPESRGSARQGPLPGSATEYLGWLWFGPTGPAEREGFFKGSEYIQSVHAATSRYRPPAALRTLAAKAIPTPALYHNTKPNYQLTQKAESTETFLIGDSYTLGTVQTPHGGWLNTAYGVVNWKLVIGNPAGLPAVITGNGGMKSTDHARGRNPFDQFLQYRSTVVQMTRVPSNAEALAAEVAESFEAWKGQSRSDFRERWGRPHQFEESHLSDNARGGLETAGWSLVYFPESVECVVRGPRAFLRHADTFVLLHTLSGRAPEKGAGKLIDRAGRDRVSGFVIEVAEAAGYASFEAFIETAGAMAGPEQVKEGVAEFHYTTLAGDRLGFQYSLSGTWSEMIYDWGSGVTGQRVGFNTDDWQQPDWPSGPGHGRIARLAVNGKRYRPHDPDAVIKGPFLSLENGVLRISDPRGNRHTVDAATFPTPVTTHAMRNSQN